MSEVHRPAAPPPPVRAPSSPRRRWDPAILGTIALGGVVGAEARYGWGLAWPHRPDQLPVATWVVNTSGCLLIGVLMVVVTELTSPHRLIRPFLGVGVLGGYTTFSTASVEVDQLARHGRPALAVGYLVGTFLAALAAVALGTASTRAAGIGWMRWRARHTAGR